MNYGESIQRVVVVGGGSAGLLSALTIRRFMPQVKVTVVHSSKIPVIGVGESTTNRIPEALHGHLKIDQGEFFRDVEPSWKLGVRLEWGVPDGHFNYPFDHKMDVRRRNLLYEDAHYCVDELADQSLFSAMMTQKRSPIFFADGKYTLATPYAYHLDNGKLLTYLEKVARDRNIEFVDDEVQSVKQHENGFISALELKDTGQLEGDFFVDCSGFRSLLLNKTLGEPWRDYGESLFCDRAIVGSYERTGEIIPYTIAETMNNGWCWQIDFAERVTRGYVYASAFCSADQAKAEMLAKNPTLDADGLREIQFPCGRFERFFDRNVAAIGNSSGFVEPLEATALTMIFIQLQMVCTAIFESGGRLFPKIQAAQNRAFGNWWDDIRDFLALHYKFNHRTESEFWEHCREKTALEEATGLVELYQEVGPTRACRDLIRRESIFEISGYWTMLMGQKVPIKHRRETTDVDKNHWLAWRNHLRSQASAAVPVRESMGLIDHPEQK